MKHPLWGEADLAPPRGSAGDAAPGARDVNRYLVLPSPADPRLVIPTRPRRASSQILRALRDRSSVKARVQTAALEAASLLNARSRALPSPELFDVIAAELGRPLDEIVIGVHLGPPRANRKPVLAVADRHGALLAFVKCGVDPLTDQLVAHEARALRHLAVIGESGDLGHCTVPTLVGSGRHGGHEYAIQSPVPTSPIPTSGRRSRSQAVVDAQRDIARIRREPSDDFDRPLDVIRQRWLVRSAASDDPVVLRFADVAAAWADLVDRVPLTWGSWHGDWRTTNMSVTSRGCSVWDWERFSSGVPVGFDALHLFLTTRLPSVRMLSALPRDVFDSAPRLLRPFAVTDRVAVELTVAGYLLELGGRYLDDDQARAGARLGQVGEWLLPTLAEYVRAHTSTPGGSQR